MSVSHNMWRKELLGGGLCYQNAFLVIIMYYFGGLTAVVISDAPHSQTFTIISRLCVFNVKEYWGPAVGSRFMEGEKLVYLIG